MPLTIKIIRGNDAHSLICDADFLSTWQLLASHTSHVTVFQESPFVTCWYQQYRTAYEPVLVLGYSDDNTLSGLLPLAIKIESQALSHAGDQQVEYSGWLCTDKFRQSFINLALATVNAKLTFSTWLWSTIPPHADVSWLTKPCKELKQLYTSYNVIDSPVLDLHNEEKLKKVLKNKSVKSKINRLKRKGELRIERITDSQRVTELINDISNLVNFRHGAAHGDLAFNEDPYQKSFYHARGSNLTSNHFSVLWMGSKLLAFHFGGIDKDTIYIGLTAFDPTQSKHSPGVIFLIYLANLMKEEGIRYIDLTPGGDEYKERFSNQHHTLYCPTFFTSATRKFQHSCKNNIKKSVLSSMNRLGIDKNKLIRTTTPDHSSSSNKNYLLLKSDITGTKATLNKDHSVNIQKYSDLLLHTDVDDSKRMQKLLNNATQRFSKEETLFTLVENNQLKGVSWMSKPGGKLNNNNVECICDDDEVIIDLTINTQRLQSQQLESLLTHNVAHAKDNNIKNIIIYVTNDLRDEAKKIISHLGLNLETS